MLRPFITKMTSSTGAVLWDAAVCDSSTSEQRVRPLMRMAFFMNYLRKTYDNQLPLIFKELNDYINGSLNELGELDADYKELMMFLAGNGHLSKKDHAKTLGTLTTCFKLLSSYSAVTDAATTFYVPYMKYLMAVDMFDAAKTEGSDAFSITGLVSIPSFRIMGTSLVVDYSVTLPGYKFDPASVKRGTASCPDYSQSFLGFLEGYDFTGKDPMSILGILATQCHERDTNLIDSNSLSFLYYRLYNKLFCMSTTVCNVSQAPKSADYIRERLLHFLKQLADRYDTVIRDGTILIDVVGNEPPSETDKKLATYFAAKSTSSIDVEAHNTFMHSGYKMFKTLDIQNRILMANEDPATPPPANTAPTGDAPAPKDPPKDPATETPSKTAPDEKVAPDKPEDKPAEAAPKDGEPTPTDTTPAPPTSSDGTHTAHTELSNGNDEAGIVLELADPVTLDSYFLRQELVTKLNALLDDPPKTISVEKLVMLKRLKAYWINIFSIRTVCDIVASATKLTLKQTHLS